MTTTHDSTLGVDVNAEIDLLASSMVQGPWQVPVEVARLAARHGARSLEFARRGSVLEFSGRGGRPPDGSLRRAVVAADVTRPEEERHAAAVTLESEGDLALLWALVASQNRVRLTVTSAAGGVAAWRDPAGRLHLEERRSEVPGVTLEMQLPGRSARRALEWLRAACRYASIPVRLDGQDLRLGITEGSHRMRIDDPLPCLVHLGTTGEGPSLRLVRHGLLVTRATVPGYPRFTAAIELAGVAPDSGSAADHRAAVTPFLPALVDRVVGGMLRLSDELPHLDRTRATPIVTELLRAGDLGIRVAAVRRAPLVEVVDVGGRSSWRTLEELTSRSGLPPAIDPEAVDHRPHGHVAVLDDESRRLAESLTGRRWPVAVTVARHRPLRSRLAAVRDAALGRLRRLRIGRAREVDHDRLGPDERALTEVLEHGAVPPVPGRVRVRWVDGTRPPVTRGSTLELGRDHPDVRRAVARLAEDRGWEGVVARAIVPSAWRVREHGSS